MRSDRRWRVDTGQAAVCGWRCSGMSACYSAAAFLRVGTSLAPRIQGPTGACGAHVLENGRRKYDKHVALFRINAQELHGGRRGGNAGMNALECREARWARGGWTAPPPAGGGWQMRRTTVAP